MRHVHMEISATAIVNRASPEARRALGMVKDAGQMRIPMTA